jgi:hypothetical protein
MKPLLLAALISFVALPLALSQTPSSTDNKTTEQEVRAAIEQYRTALTKRDAATLEKIWANDYTFINGKGAVLTKAQRLENLKSGSTTLDSINEEEEIKARLRRRHRGSDQSRDHQRSIQRQAIKWPIPPAAIHGQERPPAGNWFATSSPPSPLRR